MWIAKNSITGKTYGKKFKEIYDCVKYIDDELKILNYLYSQILIQEDLFENHLRIRIGNVIRAYNLSQDRFCDGFDF